MTATRVSLLVTALAAFLAGPRAARADQPVLVLQFSGQPSDSADALSREMAAAIRASGNPVNEATREDVYTLAGCAEPSDDCLRQALGLLEVREAVTGEVRSSGGGGVAVELRAVSPSGEPRTRTVTLSGATPRAQAREFRPEAEAFWRNEPSPAEAAAAAAAAAEPAAPPPGADLSGGGDDGGGSFSASRVEPYAWGIAGGGAGLMVVGAVLLAAADGKQSDVDDAPTDTVEDLDALVELEESGRRYARWGNVCLVVGGIAAIAGGFLIFRQGRDAGAESSAPQVTLAPSAGEGLGAAVLVRGGF